VFGIQHPGSTVITVDKNAAYPVAIKALKDDETIAGDTEQIFE